MGKAPSSRREPISVVIPTRDRPAQLARCLEVLKQSVNAQDEVLVVDSASRSTEVAVIAASHGARCVRVERPGASRARNVGWRNATHPLIAFIDDDVHVADDWADRMAEALLAEGVAFVTGRIGVLQGQEVHDPQPVMLDPEGRRLDAHTRADFGASANVGLHRWALEGVAGFDERIGPATWFPGAEDKDLFDRLVLKGYVGRYDPAVSVDHDAWRSRRDRLRQQWGYGKGTGARLRLLHMRDRRRATTAAVDLLWRRGFVQGFVRVRQRWAVGAASSFLRCVGGVLGFLVATGRLREPWPPQRHSE
ncbi:MAG: glycosyltransferase family 2 protein [Actinomycetes bacterium]